MGPRVRKKYRLMDVTADIGIITSASNLKQLYANAACALFDVMGDTTNVKPMVEIDISAQGDDAPSTMVNWLSELLYIFETRFLLLMEFHIQSADSLHVRARVRGEEYDPSRHSITRHIKAITYHRLKVAQTEKGWEAEILFDI